MVDRSPKDPDTDQAAQAGPPIGVLLLIHDLGLGGAETLVANLARALKAAGALPVVCGWRAGGDHAERLRAEGIIVEPPVHRGFGVKRLLVPFLLARMVRRHSIAVIHAHLSDSPLWALVLRRLFATPYLITHHSNNLTDNLERGGVAYGRFRLWLLGVCVRRADRNIAVSPSVRERLLDRLALDRSKLVLIPNGVPVPARPPEGDWPRSPEAPTVLYAGRFEPEKGVDILIESVPLFLKLHPGARFVLLGEGSQHPRLRARARELGVAERVEMPGPVPDITKWLRRADLLAVPSRIEGLPLVVLEAMAQRLPVVATDIPGNRDLIGADEHGWLCAAESPDALAVRLDAALSRLQETRDRAERALAMVRERYGLDALARHHISIYRSVLEGNAAGGAAELVRGAAAEALLREPAFLEGWRRLWEDCPWATAFQSAAFATTWYRVYREVYEPALVIERASDGTLAGLLTLAVGRETGAWRVAGLRQAEYQAWLAEPDDRGGFVEQALRLAFAAGAGRLDFLYLPADAPLGWAETGPLRRRVLRRRWSRPLMRLDDPAWIRKSLAKRGNKSRLKRLGRDGELRLELVTERARLAEVLGCFTSLCDFRHGAAHGTLPFHDDPLRGPFQLALMEHPGLLHATLLRSGDRLLAAHLGLSHRGVLYNGLLTYSPFEARNSPGKLHVLLMGRLVAEDGFSCFDLTPGDDPWKERFANAGEQVTEVTVYRSVLRRNAVAGALAAKALARRALSGLGLAPTALRQALVELLRGGPSAWLGLLGRRERLRVFQLAAGQPLEATVPEGMAQDDLGHLVDHLFSRRRETPSGFLADALVRLEQGQHFLSLRRDGRLGLLAWLVDAELAPAWSLIRLGARCPEKTAFLELFDTRSRGSDDRELAGAIARGTALLRAGGDGIRVLVVVPAALRGADRLLRRLGAVDLGEAVRLRLLWASRLSAWLDLDRAGA